MNKRTLLAGCITAIAGFLAFANVARAVDLLSVVEQSTDHDADLAAMRAASRAAQQAVPKARAGLLPQVEGGWGRGWNSTSIEDLPRNSYWQSGWTVSLTQPIFDWSRWTGYRQANFVEARGVIDVARAQQTSILRAAQAYFDELAAEDELARASDYTTALDAHMNELRRRQSAGEATLVDVQEAESVQGQARLQLMDAQNDLQLKRIALEQLTGQPFSALSRLSSRAALPHLDPDDGESWATQAEAHDYAVQLKQIDCRIAELEVEKVRAGYLPTVNLTANHTPAGAAAGFSRPTTTTTAMLAISIPIFEGGETQAKLDESEALQDKAQNELLAATRQAGGVARENWSRFAAGTMRIEALTRLVQNSRTAISATYIGYKVGSRTSADVLRAIDTFYATRRDLIRARYDVLLALLQLKAATAALTIDEVVQVNSLLTSADTPAAKQP
jgi:outer membrane protein